MSPSMTVAKALFLCLLILGRLTAAHAESPRITDVTIFDKGTISEGGVDASIDTHMGECGKGTETTPEPFFTTMLGLTVHNPTFVNFRVSKVRYELTRVGSKRKYRSRGLAAIGPLEVKATKSGIIYVPILPVGSGEKIFPGTSIAASSVQGLRTMRITLDGTIASRRVTLSARFTASFNDFDRCSD